MAKNKGYITIHNIYIYIYIYIYTVYIDILKSPLNHCTNSFIHKSPQEVAKQADIRISDSPWIHLVGKDISGHLGLKHGANDLFRFEYKCSGFRSLSSFGSQRKLCVFDVCFHCSSTKSLTSCFTWTHLASHNTHKRPSGWSERR